MAGGGEAERANPTISALFEEHRVFFPPPEFTVRATVRDRLLYENAERDLEGFWAEAAEGIDWFRKWDHVLEWNPPFAKWFLGGKLNAAYNCLDRHVRTWRRNKAAIIWEGEPGEQRVLTYGDVHREVSKFANVLKHLGVKKGDRVALYMPMIPELVVALLACARLGAPHTAVFGGFSPESLRGRINDAQAKVVITADGGFRRGSIVPLKQNVDEALAGCPSVENVILVRRIGEAVHMHFHYLWLLGRVDDVMNVSGHRISTIEVESALVDHKDVAEAAVIGRSHAVKGQAVSAFVTLKAGVPLSRDKVDDLKTHVTEKIGALARPDEIFFTAELPKTRSGKIMRRLLRDIAEGRALGDTTTLADPTVIARLRTQYEESGDGP